ncbi:hypothetical protein GBA52_018224 [Prunus armeniaca]|nr:hypothetical protein GBA52_018224 [Prunus armeniaca]
MSSTPPSEDVSKLSSDDNNDYGSITQKRDINLNLCSARASFSNIIEAESAQNMNKSEGGGSGESDEASNDGTFRGSNDHRHREIDSQRSSKGALAPANWKGTNKVGPLELFQDCSENENKVKMVKLKVGNVTRTIQAKSTSDGASAVGSSSIKSSHISDAPRPRQKLILQENSDDNRSFGSDKGNEERKSRKERKISTVMKGVVLASLGASPIEFPNGLPPAPPRKQKEKLCALEQQIKKAEAAERRRMQVEKAARESEAEAIRKILGQDSSRKKREDKIKKRQEDLAQERAANAFILPSDSVRWVMGPSGSIVTFPDEMGLPAIFDSKPCSYPPPREKCAGPYCRNPYKYRDSQSKLPLCSLQCYKAIHEKTAPLSAC